VTAHSLDIYACAQLNRATRTVVLGCPSWIHVARRPALAAAPQ